MMRWSNKKVALILIIIMVLIAILYHFPMLHHFPKSDPVQTKQREVELKLQKLEQKLHMQNQEITKLLEALKTYMPKTESSAKDEAIKGVYSEEMAIAEPPSSLVLPVLVMACDRVTVKRCLDNLLRFRPDKNMFPIIVSQDCDHEATYRVIKQYADADPSVTVVKQPDQSDIHLAPHQTKFKGYYKIARHFKFALSHVYEKLGYDAVIIVEDDLDISSDFFEYFQGTYPLLRQDPSIWCVSAWNDNGKQHVIDVNHPELLHRTDFFPGLGWTMRRETWLELAPKWPKAFFDDWLRDPKNTRGRSCIRPEVSRTYSFGKIGVSKGQFFEVHLKYTQLNQKFVEFTKLDLQYLLKENYDPALKAALAKAKLMSAAEVMTSPVAGPSAEVTPAKVYYSDAASFQKNAKILGLMEDFRSGIPRTAYNGTVTCFVRGRRVYLTPSFGWERYAPDGGKPGKQE